VPSSVILDFGILGDKFWGNKIPGPILSILLARKIEPTLNPLDKDSLAQCHGRFTAVQT
jgi:hypothetical protein